MSTSRQNIGRRVAKPIRTELPTLQLKDGGTWQFRFMRQNGVDLAAVMRAMSGAARYEFGISVEHPLQREFRDDPFPVLVAEPLPCRRLVQQAPDRGGEGGVVIARHDEVLVVPGHHRLDIPDIDRSDRQAGGHSLQNRIRHLLGVGRQRENVKAAQDGFRKNLAGEDDTLGDPELPADRSSAPRSLPSPAITSRTGTLVSSIAKTRNSRPIFFSGRNGATVPTINSPGRRINPGSASRTGAAKRSTSTPFGK